MVWEINMAVCPRLDFEILCYLIVLGITLIFMVRLSFYAIPLLRTSDSLNEGLPIKIAIQKFQRK